MLGRVIAGTGEPPDKMAVIESLGWVLNMTATFLSHSSGAILLCQSSSFQSVPSPADNHQDSVAGFRQRR